MPLARLGCDEARYLLKWKSSVYGLMVNYSQRLHSGESRNPIDAGKIPAFAGMTKILNGGWFLELHRSDQEFLVAVAAFD